MTWVKETDRKFESYFGSGFIPLFGIISVVGGIIDGIVAFMCREWRLMRTWIGLIVLVGIGCLVYGRIRHVHRNPPREEPHQD
ncbi:MAG: hypothetical protein SPI12_06405 [Actinomycetaceae bacterium]|nr:hypothetical protein [Actinomycetaceae bacterium]MDY6083469.1 hypothetical protein [Actinomycetaceae bacterium]